MCARSRWFRLTEPFPCGLWSPTRPGCQSTGLMTRHVANGAPASARRRGCSMPAENAGRAFARALVDQLARLGVQHAAVAPGSRSTPIALALLEHPDITVHVRIDERSAAYLALGIAKASAQVVPVQCTSGTATTYFHGAVMEADLARVPLLVLTADRPAELHGIGANQTVEQSG